MVYTARDAAASSILAAGSPFRRQVKIVATLGPSVSEVDNLAAIIDTGVDVARVNCAHGTIEGRTRQIAMVREIAESRRRNIPILLDLPGLKIRTGPLEGSEPAMLARGTKVRVYSTPVISTREQLGVTYPDLLSVVQPESRILLADGLIELVVESIENDHVVCGVGRGGPLAGRQGVTLPNVRLQNASLTEQDKIDIRFAARQRVEYLGLSFISSADDIIVAREYARTLGITPGIVAKIERPAAIDDMDAIVRTADAVMVARGDMGVQLPLERVPIVQKEIIAACNRAGTPVITATQMLESMIMQPVPTRAETSDVANAVLDGTDAVMLSAETATGRHPVAAVEMMSRIIHEVERHGPIRSPAVSRTLPATDPEQIITDALGRAAREMTDAAPIDCIVVFTLSGASARLVAKFRPGVPVIAMTTDPYVARKLSLVWGIRALVFSMTDDIDELFATASRQTIEAGYANVGDEALFVGSIPIYRVSGRTNLLHVRTLTD
ncbi:MAG TPA: pyruvate kinase [Thermomicrobiales bacterium]|jgi:pyruvate kinase|nr:pyruvate kinase [Chloroflexota bacterium]HBY46045.1 pyruvate kinase [Chloroflexota bacterium]HCG29708.1 pyruvate kinase [Chloroflexota bacterium]HQZ88477.1 pyruvate kinase [Thermomicrobiales bacterium]HRA30393.1 pyruvate kinase [Thermomicrobiales bacterium]